MVRFLYCSYHLIAMKVWPIKNAIIKNIPEKPLKGSFWENRTDRFHIGVDIYASE